MAFEEGFYYYVYWHMKYDITLKFLQASNEILDRKMADNREKEGVGLFSNEKTDTRHKNNDTSGNDVDRSDIINTISSIIKHVDKNSLKTTLESKYISEKPQTTNSSITKRESDKPMAQHDNGVKRVPESPTESKVRNSYLSICKQYELCRQKKVKYLNEKLS